MIVTLLLTEVVTSVYTEDFLQVSTKTHVIDLFLEIQEQTISTISS